MQYRNYHASILLPTGDRIERSVFVADVGAGTKRAGRELVRGVYGARSVRLHTGKLVDAPRKGCDTFGATKVKAMRADLNRRKRQAAQAA